MKNNEKERICRSNFNVISAARRATGTDSGLRGEALNFSFVRYYMSRGGLREI